MAPDPEDRPSATELLQKLQAIGADNKPKTVPAALGQQQQDKSAHAEEPAGQGQAKKRGFTCNPFTCFGRNSAQSG